MHEASLTIKIWADDATLPDDLSEALAPHAEHVAALLQEGYLSGEIVDDRFRGWWSIDQTTTPTAPPVA